MARWPSTLRWRLTLWYTALLGAPLIALAIGYYLFFARTLYTKTDQFISDALVAFSRELVAERRASSGITAAIRSTVDEVRFRDLHIAILDSAGGVVAMTPLPDLDARHLFLNRSATSSAPTQCCRSILRLDSASAPYP